MARTYVLETRQHLPRPLSEVFDFFAEAANLQTITPPWLDFRVATPLPITMGVGTLIDYRLKLHGVPIGWRTRIASWDPPHQFVDEQLRGPYRRWIHTHTFESASEGTLVRDCVEYAVPGGALTHWLLVGRDVRRIFAYRGERLAELFGGEDRGRQSLTVRKRTRADG